MGYTGEVDVENVDPLAQALTLPCGATLNNRIAKAAMTEGLADANDRVTERHETLYRRWSEGGAGLLITGNVMIDRRYLERPGNVVIGGNDGEQALERWVAAGTRGGNQLWMQINHPGRQCSRMSSSSPVAPSAVPMKGMMGLMANPRALTDAEVRGIIVRWAEVAGVAKERGFTGVQVHAAHGYLISQFLSPYTNRRDDDWGGSLESRARLLLETVKAVRERVGESFAVAVKLNSSDFQKGGFSNEESAQVAAWLAELGIDLLELSGGNYEQTALFGQLDEAPKAASTKRREAYFLEYARVVAEACPDLPLMVTGGFRSAALMREVVSAGVVDVVGLARPFCVMPDLARRVLAGELNVLPHHEQDQRLGPGLLGRASPMRSARTLNAQAEVAWFYAQIIHLSEGREPDLTLGTWSALAQHFGGEAARARARSRAR
jgi:2,4-dienoyl-CoA reductase-like NADH-dependent reductase (Old Yellow Enzyme family)